MYVALEIFRTEKILTVFFRFMKPCSLLGCTGLSEKKYCLPEEEIHSLEVDDSP